MKRLYIVGLLFMLSCGSNEVVTNNKQTDSSRINLVEASWGRLNIYEVDGCEYLAAMEGGVIHLETCKNHENEINR